MMLVGCDYHPSWQQFWGYTRTGATEQRKLVHASGEAEKFYRRLAAPAVSAWSPRATASGLWRWLDSGARDVDRRCGQDPGQLCAQAEHGQAGRGSSVDATVGETVSSVLDTIGDAGSAAVATPPGQAGRDPDKVKNSLQHLAMNRGMKEEAGCGRQGMEQFRQLAMPLGRGAAVRLVLAEEMERQMEPFDLAVVEAAGQHPQAQLLMTQPGVGPVTALAFVLTIGDVSRFAAR